MAGTIGMPMRITQTVRFGLNEVRPRRPEQSVVEFLFTPLDGLVSMKSGLEGRNNRPAHRPPGTAATVSMKSGLEGRNNCRSARHGSWSSPCLNEVRPRRPEQWVVRVNGMMR